MNCIPLRIATGALLVLSPVAGASAQRLEPADVANLPTVSDPRLSPDGQWVMYVQKVPADLEADRAPDGAQLWRVSADGGEPRAFTSPSSRVSRPRWSPTGDRIAFLDRRPPTGEDSKAQVYVMPSFGGEAERMTDSEENVSEVAWAPDGDSIFFTATEAKSKERREGEKKGRDWVVVDQNERHRALWRLDLTSGETARVSEAPLSFRHISVSPDGSRIAALVADSPRVDDSYVYQRLVTVDVASGSVNEVWDVPGKAVVTAFSPDGSEIATLAGIAAHDPAAGSIFVVGVDGGEPRNLTPDYDGTVEWLQYDDDGGIVFVATRGVWSGLERVDPETGEIAVWVGEGPEHTSAHLASSAGRIVAAASTPEHPAEILVRDMGPGEWRRLTRSYPHLEEKRLGRQEPVQWTARDGLRIEGVLVYPLDYEEGRAYPLVVGVHGGPESAVRNGWHTGHSYLSQLLSHRGSFFLLPNYRGSTGRGVGYLLADHGDPAGDEFQDVLDGIAWLADRGLVDPDRVGMMGGSYGGYFSAWAATRHTEHFRAAVVNYGVSNLWSDWGDGDIPHEHKLVHWGWYPVDRPGLAMDRSPVAWVLGSRTATLIMHGASDTRVPAAQSRELYQGLRLNEDLPLEFVLFPREGHGYRESPHRLEACRRALAWMVEHLGLAPHGQSAPQTAR